MLRAGCNGTAENGYLTQGGMAVIVVEWRDILGTKMMNQVKWGMAERSAKSGKPESHSLFGEL